MSDIVERLREKSEWTNQRPYFHAHDKCIEAAAEITRLRAELTEAPAMVAALRQVVNLAELHIAERSATPEEEEDFLSCAYLVNARAILSRIDGAGEALPDTPAPNLPKRGRGGTGL